MKKFPVIFLVCALAGFASVYAQEKLLVNVPFDFIVAGATLPAGEYRIEQFTALLIQVHGTGGQGNIFSQAIPVDRRVIPEVITGWQPGPASAKTNPGNPQNQPPHALQSTAGYSVIFHKYSQTYFMANVWAGHNGHQLQMCQSEKALRTAGTSNQAETVMLAALAAR